jgi:hypothetical protein
LCAGDGVKDARAWVEGTLELYRHREKYGADAAGGIREGEEVREVEAGGSSRNALVWLAAPG